MRSLLLTVVLLTASVAVPGCIVAGGGDATLTIENDSSYLIVEIRLAPTDSVVWGRNLLGGEVLFPGEYLTVNLDCDYYDVLVVDDTNVECELRDLDLCFSDSLWVITNRTLDRCAFGR